MSGKRLAKKSSRRSRGSKSSSRRSKGSRGSKRSRGKHSSSNNETARHGGGGGGGRRKKYYENNTSTTTPSSVSSHSHKQQTPSLVTLPSTLISDIALLLPFSSIKILRESCSNFAKTLSPSMEPFWAEYFLQHYSAPWSKPDSLSSALSLPSTAFYSHARTRYHFSQGLFHPLSNSKSPLPLPFHLTSVVLGDSPTSPPTPISPTSPMPLFQTTAIYSRSPWHSVWLDADSGTLVLHDALNFSMSAFGIRLDSNMLSSELAATALGDRGVLVAVPPTMSASDASIVRQSVIRLWLWNGDLGKAFKPTQLDAFTATSTTPRLAPASAMTYTSVAYASQNVIVAATELSLEAWDIDDAGKPLWISIFSSRSFPGLTSGKLHQRPVLLTSRVASPGGSILYITLRPKSSGLRPSSVAKSAQPSSSSSSSSRLTMRKSSTEARTRPSRRQPGTASSQIQDRYDVVVRLLDPLNASIPLSSKVPPPDKGSQVRLQVPAEAIERAATEHAWSKPADGSFAGLEPGSPKRVREPSKQGAGPSAPFGRNQIDLAHGYVVLRWWVPQASTTVVRVWNLRTRSCWSSPEEPDPSPLPHTASFTVSDEVTALSWNDDGVAVLGTSKGSFHVASLINGVVLWGLEGHVSDKEKSSRPRTWAKLSVGTAYVLSIFGTRLRIWDLYSGATLKGPLSLVPGTEASLCGDSLVLGAGPQGSYIHGAPSVVWAAAVAAARKLDNKSDLSVSLKTVRLPAGINIPREHVDPDNLDPALVNTGHSAPDYF